MRITAAVVYERSDPFTVEAVDLCEPRADELLVQVVASGMCATDLHGRDAYYPTRFPKIFGHEGAGIVRAVGSAVTEFKPGDHVVMAYPWCGECQNCRSARQSYCLHSRELKNERHPRRRLDAALQGRQAGLQRLLPAIVVRLITPSPTNAIAVKVRSDAPIESSRNARLRRTDRRRRGAQCVEARARREFRGVRRRHGRIIGSDGSEDRRLRSDHCRRCARHTSFARARYRRDAYDQSREHR